MRRPTSVQVYEAKTLASPITELPATRLVYHCGQLQAKEMPHMSLFGGKETATIAYTYEVVEESIEIPTSDENDPDASTTSGNHCA